MRILFIGADNHCTTSFHRAEALRRLGHEVIHVNPRRPMPNNRWGISLAVRTGFRLFGPLIRRHILRSIGDRSYDVIWLDCCPEVGPRLLRRLKRGGARTVGYMNDDPFGGRDGLKWGQFLAALPEYDFLAVVRTVNIEEALRAGAPRVGRVFMSYDPVAHQAPAMTPAEVAAWSRPVVFVGSWWPERGPFFAELVERGVPVSIYGDRWVKAPEFSRFRAVCVGREANGLDYARAIAGATISIGMLSQGNRDLHTQRSVEIPAIGGLLCAERTVEHTQMFKEGKEALFWSSAEECAAQCRHLLENPFLCASMAAAGQRRVRQLGLSNDEVVGWILEKSAGTAANQIMQLPPHSAD